ncbi:uncharacterized protein KY384_009071 [Bacidia gigantensis]|uniref:uncharacterized protein n=1 Tax=Bacidia gigantensis TaxID=2732470 RepID=UPI001D04EFC4|nr:uncharacterized protein KY384_009071 [Bacidia gigantensis]KAG8525427.1 hypothetical protein KY384_009071 [Bacidia gigantensis]
MSNKHPPPTSPHIGFYKQFGRPVAKVFLGAIFVYQVVYLGWTIIETDVVRDRKQREELNNYMIVVFAKALHR